MADTGPTQPGGTGVPAGTKQSFRVQLPAFNVRIGLSPTGIEGRPAVQGEVDRGSPGAYDVTLALYTPGKQCFHEGDMDLDAILAAGESRLTAPSDPVLNIAVGDPRTEDRTLVQITFHRDSEGSLRAAQLRLNAPDAASAQRQAYDLLQPVLSWWGFRYDVAIDVLGWRCVEVATGIPQIMLGFLGPHKNLRDDGMRTVWGEYAPILGAYRDGNNAVNPLYRSLSYYKVTEGIRKLRTRRRQDARAAGDDYRDPGNERFPSTETDIEMAPSLQPLFAPYLGRRFMDVLEREMREQIRNAYAHLNPLEPFLTTDLFDDFIKADAASVILKYVARIMLTNEIQWFDSMRALQPSTHD